MPPCERLSATLPCGVGSVCPIPGRFVLLGHFAKPNPHWRHLQAAPRALAMFMGPHAYQSPRIYPDLQRVPSWNYLTVHCKVQARLVEDRTLRAALFNVSLENDRVMLCGSPHMLRDTRKLLEDAGFKEGSNNEPGHYVVEKALVG